MKDTLKELIVWRIDKWSFPLQVIREFLQSEKEETRDDMHPGLSRDLNLFPLACSQVGYPLPMPHPQQFFMAYFCLFSCPKSQAKIYFCRTFKGQKRQLYLSHKEKAISVCCWKVTLFEMKKVSIFFIPQLSKLPLKRVNNRFITSKGNNWPKTPKTQNPKTTFNLHKSMNLILKIN